MEFSYILKEEDFLLFNLFTLKNSEQFEKRIKRGIIILIVLICIASVYAITSKEFNLLFISGAFIVAILFFYRNFYKWRMKRHYTKFVKEMHQEQIDQKEVLNFQKTEVIIENQLGKGKFNKSEIKAVSEIKELIMLHLESGASIVIPKRDFTKTEALKNELKNLTWNTNLDWKY